MTSREVEGKDRACLGDQGLEISLFGVNPSVVSSLTPRKRKRHTGKYKIHPRVATMGKKREKARAAELVAGISSLLTQNHCRDDKCSLNFPSNGTASCWDFRGLAFPLVVVIVGLAIFFQDRVIIRIEYVETAASNRDGKNMGSSTKKKSFLLPTPPMGFNSYMATSYLQNEAGLRRVADFLEQHDMKSLGYVFINTDEGWEEKTRTRDGQLTWNTTLYPSGLPAFIDELHSRGFKFGIYGAASAVTCGVNPGQLYNEVIDAQTYANWNVDYLKSDNCANFALDSSVRFRAMAQALQATGRQIVLSIEPFSMTPDPSQSSETGAHLWRTGTDITGKFEDIMERVDTADKWAPMAGPTLGWNDPDMINVHGNLTLGQNRIYFGLFCLMKSPLLLSTNLYQLRNEILEIVVNSELIGINQDPLGIPARKIQVDGLALPWLVGPEDCATQNTKYYSRKVAQDMNFNPKAGPGSVDARVWNLQELPHTAPLTSNVRLIRNNATGRCLTAINGAYVALLPCSTQSNNRQQWWKFEKGVTTVTSVTTVRNLALAVGNSYVNGRIHGKDDQPTSDAAYGDAGMVLEDPQIQTNCTSRWCENYSPSQMWYFSPEDGFLRHALYAMSMNHVEEYQDNSENGYILTKNVPTYRHHCLAHVLSKENVGTTRGTTEVWGGPLSGGDFVAALVNRGQEATKIELDLDLLLETLGYDDRRISLFLDRAVHIRDLWQHTEHQLLAGSFIEAKVPAHDVVIYRLQFIK